MKKGTGTKVSHYQLGKEIGKGGFGTVYQGMDTETGRFVAVKQVNTADVPKETLESIHIEIKLLKKLQHDNIVRYYDSVETGKTFNIVLEFVENGSLSDIIVKFGTFSESLAVMYISQVLLGLDYLHTQGVIHRDIKGANILTTKNGLVKLADFGVAIGEDSAGGADGAVGTPYWMAPEIIELAGATTKCDIWSVGCVVIELITSEPPYYDLAPMAALFRIVQDADGPKIPSGVSPVLRDFLRKCFHKDPNFRKNAKELIVHPWLRAERDAINVEPDAQAQIHEDEVAKLEMKEAMKATLKISKIQRATLRSHVTLKRPNKFNAVDTVDFGTEDPMMNLSSMMRLTESSDDGTSCEDWDSELHESNQQGKSVGDIKGKLRDFGNLFKDEDAIDDFWEEDEDDTAKFIASTVAPSPAKEDPPADRAEVVETVTPKGCCPKHHDIVLKTVGFGPFRKTKPCSKCEEECLSSTSNASEGDARCPMHPDTVLKSPGFSLPFSKPKSCSRCKEERMDDPGGSSLKNNSSFRKLEQFKDTNDDDFGDIDFGSDEDEQPAVGVDKLRHFQETASDGGGFSDFEDEIDLGKKSIGTMRKLASKMGEETTTKGIEISAVEPEFTVTRAAVDSRAQLVGNERVSAILDHHEEEEEGFYDLEFDGDLSATLVCKQQGTGMNENPFEDPFADPDQMFDEDDYVQDSERDAQEKRLGKMEKLLELLSAQFDLKMAKTAIDTCHKLLSLLGLLRLLNQRPEDSNSVLKEKSSLLVRLVDIYAIENSALEYVLSVILALVKDNPVLRGKLAILGIIPRLMRLLSRHNPKRHVFNVFLNANKIVLEFLRGGTDNTAGITIACGGLKSLTYVIALAPKQEYSSLVFEAIDLVIHVLKINKGISKNDACRLMSEDGILPYLSSACACFVRATTQNDLAYANKVIEILGKFANGHAVVKRFVACQGVLTHIVGILGSTDDGNATGSNLLKIHKKLLQIIRTLVMESSILDQMQESNIVAILVPFMKSPVHRNVILLILFYLTRLSSKRQVIAAKAGLVPLLQNVIDRNDPLKQTALQIFCDMAHASDVTRQILWDHGGVERFLGLLTDRYWFHASLVSLSKWLSNDKKKRLEKVLAERANLNLIVIMFKNTKGSDFENSLGPFRELIYKGNKLNRAIGMDGSFVEELMRRISVNNKAMVRFTLLKLLKSIFEQHQYKKKLLSDHQLVVRIQQLVDDEEMVLVNEMATQLLALFAKVKK
jgi:serine/threonine protein kinase